MANSSIDAAGDERRTGAGDTPLAELFGTGPKVKLLAAFLSDPDLDYNVTELAQSAGIARKTVYAHVDDLVSLGVVERKREEGSNAQYTLAEDSEVARHVAELEWELLELTDEE